jgi:type II secretory pathway pseudopilin PulG
VIVGLAIIVILTAIMIPFYARYSDQSTAAQISANLRMLSTAIGEYRSDVGAYPPNIGALTVAQSGSSTDLCGVTLTLQQYSGWNGPYLGRDISTTRLVMESDTLNTVFGRTPSTALTRASSGTLDIAVWNTSAQRAAYVEETLEGGVSSTSTFGPGIWGTVGGRPQLTYRITIAGC